PRDASEHTRLFGAPVSFGFQANAFAMDREFLERQVPAAHERLYPILKHYLDDILTGMPRGDEMLAPAPRLVGESMSNGEPKLAAMGKRLAMGPRTLQRRLKDNGVEFKSLVDDTRRQLALGYLRDPAHTLAEIAYLLGYSEVSAFNRAFRRWTGSTPSEYRQRASR